MLFAFICNDKPDHLDVRMEMRQAHLGYLNRLNAEGRLKIAGPFLDAEGKPYGSLVIVEAVDIEAARVLADADPYAKAGLFQSVDVRPYNWVFNNPGA